MVIRLTSGLQERGHDIHVAIVHTDGRKVHPIASDLEASGASIHSIAAEDSGYRREVRELRALLERLRPHALHTHGYRPAVLHPRATRKVRPALVTTLHGFTGGGLKNRFYEWLQLRAARHYDAVVAVSNSMAPRLRRAGIDPARVHTIPNAWTQRHSLQSPLDARAALGVPPRRFHVGWIGRLSPEKGPDLLIEACQALGDLDITVSIIGDGSLHERLRAEAAANSKVDIRLHGSIPAAARLIPAFDLLVLSSRSEGTPIVLFEAMDAAVPIVAASVGGVPDVLDLSTAILVPPESPKDLALAIRSVHDHPRAADERARLGREQLAIRHGVASWVDRHVALYEALTRDLPGGGVVA